jgi:hypothetical protein
MCILSVKFVVYIFEIYVNFAFFDTHKPQILKKKFDSYIVLDPEKCDLSSKGHLTKQKNFCCFWYFYIEMNILQGYSQSKSIFCLKSTYSIVQPTRYSKYSSLSCSLYYIGVGSWTKYRCRKDKFVLLYSRIFRNGSHVAHNPTQILH